MVVSRRCLLVTSLAALLLGACAHSRVVSRDYDRPSRVAMHHAAQPMSRASTESVPANGLHVVRAGETLYGISFRYGLRYQDVAAWNAIGDPYTIEIGQRLRLRAASGARAASATAWQSQARSPSPSQSAQPQSPSQPSPPRLQQQLQIPRTTAPIAATQSAQPMPTLAHAPVLAVPPPALPPPSSPAQGTPLAAGGTPPWRWPTQGQIIGRYVPGDQTQQGINIAGSAGQNVVAAADGVVVYSGSGLVGYGELIIIKHSDEWLSAYAHNRRRLVGEGTRVRAGDSIAEMGRTGAVRDMLHFEIRRNGKPVDPLALLPNH